MARIPRIYRVRSVHGDGRVEIRNYQTPEAAEERRERFEIADPFASISVTASHPVTFPEPTGDLSPMDIPDSIIAEAKLHDLFEHLGIAGPFVVGISVAPGEVLVEYQPDLTGKRKPKIWRVGIE